jgi:C_GCAxxG_C_C family probable redox protein
MKKNDQVLTTFRESMNCSQAVLASFSGDMGMDEKTAIKIASAFGGGIARNGETCGAVTGALMAIGLKHFNTDLLPDEAKMHVYSLSNRFMQEFKTRNGSVKCKELLGVDLSTDEGRKKMREENLSQKVCKKLVCDSVEILEKLL